ncbi:MAG: nucleotide exchange factor GrpE [Candidatus Micrarchaeota archaeon]|nr:nucleotide exchange factor GrpE [Candidatus Micrarchaeota archaeon]
MEKNITPGKEPPAQQAAAKQKHDDEKRQPSPPQDEAAQDGAPAEKGMEGIEQEFAGLSDRLLRLTAEFDNYKKRTAREKDDICRASEARLMLRLLPAYEEAGLAANEVEKMPDSATKKGVLLVLGNLRASFEKEGLQPMKLEGEKLDPFRHESAMQEESSAPDGTIVRVIKQGYLYKGEVLRHAIVSVSSGKKAEKMDENKSEVGE